MRLWKDSTRLLELALGGKWYPYLLGDGVGALLLANFVGSGKCVVRHIEALKCVV